jgi:hypothetical protein
LPFFKADAVTPIHQVQNLMFPFAIFLEFVHPLAANSLSACGQLFNAVRVMHTQFKQFRIHGFTPRSHARDSIAAEKHVFLCSKTHLQRRAYHHSNFESVLKLLFTPIGVNTNAHGRPLPPYHASFFAEPHPPTFAAGVRFYFSIAMEEYVSTEVQFIPLSRQHKFLHFMTTIMFE